MPGDGRPHSLAGNGPAFASGLFSCSSLLLPSKGRSDPQLTGLCAQASEGHPGRISRRVDTQACEP